MKHTRHTRLSRTLRLSSITLAIAALSACAVVSGKHEPLAQVNNDVLNLPNASGQTLAQWPHEGWWRAYNDTTLNRLIEQALAEGPSLHVLAQRAKTAQSNADAVRKSHYPAGQIKATWTGQKFFDANVDAYQQNLQGYLQQMGMSGGIPDQGMEQTDISAGLSWDLDLWGKNRAAYNAALGQSRAQALEYEAARQGVITQIVGLHANIAALQSRQAILRQMIALQNTLKQRWLERERAGLQPVQQSVQTDIMIAQLEQLAAGLSAQHEVLRAQLAALIGATPQQLPAIGTTGTAGTSTTWNVLPLPNNLSINILGSRPDIAAAREYIHAASEQVASVRAEFYPDINLSVFAGLQIIGLNDILRFSGKNMGVRPAITLPLFSSVQLNAKLRIQQAQLDTAIAQYNKTVYEAISDTAQQLAQHRQSQTQVSQQARIVKNQQKLAELARQRYQVGMSPQMEMLGLQAAALSAQDALYANYAARRLQEARLANSLGIGFSDALAANVSHAPDAAATNTDTE